MSIPRKTPLARGGRIKAKKRKPSEKQRIYGGPDRIEWIKTLPCIAGPHCCGPIENAHTESGGVGRKADARSIVPLCGFHHHILHQHGVQTFQAMHGLDLLAEAARVAALWQAMAA